MARFVIGVDREQATLLPECLEDWVSENNPVRVVDVFVGALDLADLEPCFKIVDERCGQILPDGFAFIGRFATNGSFDALQRRDAFQRFFGNA
jgi:hypothetical protein